MTKEKDGQLKVDVEDEVVRGALVTHDGEVTWPPPKVSSPSPPPQKVAAPKEEVAPEPPNPVKHWIITAVVGVLSILMLWLIGNYAPPDFVSHLTVFVLACFVGWQLVWNVTPALHTPLMSVTNAISGIIIVGGILQMSGFGSGATGFATFLAALAVLIAMINVAGGFLVTQRMLGMFRKGD